MALLSSCGDKSVSKGKTDVAEVAPKPGWVDQRPFSSAYYIGVGTANKKAQPLDYQNAAKKNALNDLASEISVRVQGTTFLNTLEVNKNFSEEFISNITTSTDEKIEDYEVAGIWENENEYWIYYRLNKSQYQQNKAIKKSKAQDSAYDFYLKGLDAEQNSNVSASIDLYLRGLFAIQDYWNETNEYQTEGGKVFLDNNLYSSLQRIASGLQINVPAPKIVLSAENSYKANSNYEIAYSGKGVSGITTIYSFPKDKYMKPRVQLTDNQGFVSFLVEDVKKNTKDLSLSISIDLLPLQPADLDKKITKALLENLKTESRLVPIEFVAPSFVVTSSEKVYGQASNSSTLASTMQNQLIEKGLRLGTASNADYSITIEANTTEGGTSQGFVVAFIEMTVEVKSKSGETVYRESINNLKGLQLNKDAASLDAYKKGREKLESQMITSILESIF
ncbi:MAG: LPP20 family lipoprotein [Flavobacteriales bacterium]